MRSIVVLSATAGVVGVAGLPTTDPFLLAFCFVFWGGVTAGGLLQVAKARASDGKRTKRAPAEATQGPWVDDCGVHHFPGDVFDVENHPRPGAHGHF